LLCIPHRRQNGKALFVTTPRLYELREGWLCFLLSPQRAQRAVVLQRLQPRLRVLRVGIRQLQREPRLYAYEARKWSEQQSWACDGTLIDGRQQDSRHTRAASLPHNRGTFSASSASSSS